MPRCDKQRHSYRLEFHCRECRRSIVQEFTTKCSIKRTGRMSDIADTLRAVVCAVCNDMKRPARLYFICTPGGYDDWHIGSMYTNVKTSAKIWNTDNV